MLGRIRAKIRRSRELRLPPSVTTYWTKRRDCIREIIRDIEPCAEDAARPNSVESFALEFIIALRIRVKVVKHRLELRKLLFLFQFCKVPETPGNAVSGGSHAVLVPRRRAHGFTSLRGGCA